MLVKGEYDPSGNCSIRGLWAATNVHDNAVISTAVSIFEVLIVVNLVQKYTKEPSQLFNFAYKRAINLKPISL